MFGANGLVSRNTPASGTVWYAFDERGNVAQRVGGNGALLSTDLYDAFGKKRSGAADVFGFGGQAGYYTDVETGLILCTNRHYDPQQGRFLTRDPLGYGGGINLYSYTANNPINWMDPDGLDWLDDTSNFFAGWGDTLTFGGTDILREEVGINGGIDHSNGWYYGGEAAGFLHSVAFGGAGGLRAAGSKAAGKEFSHWIPDRLLKRGPSWLRNRFGKSTLNGNYVSPQRHYMHDPYRYPRGWRNLGPRYSPPVQQLDRVPRVVYGCTAGAAVGGASVGLNNRR